MSKLDFKQLLRNYLDGTCTEEELRLIDRWYDTLGHEAELSFTETERNQLKARMWQHIEEETVEETFSEKVIPLWKKVKIWQVAAAILVLVGFFTIKNNSFSGIFNNKEVSASVRKGFIEERNTTDADMQIELSDGSQVTLLPQSAIQYPETFKPEKREVYLSGNAFFEVTKNPAQPFYVYAGKVTTQVLGTSFWVKANKNTKQVEVEVRSGQVSVFEEKSLSESRPTRAKAQGVVLTPNQKVTYFEENKHWVTGLVPQPEPLDYQENIVANFKFSEMPLSEVLADLEKAYGIDIVVSNPNLKNCSFTGDISQQPLYTKLELICRSIGAEYEVRGTDILVNGKGCN